MVVRLDVGNDRAIGRFERRRRLGVVHAGHGHGARHGGRVRQHGAVGVGGVGLVLPGLVLVTRRVRVAGGHVHRRARRRQAIDGVAIRCGRGIGEAGVAAKRNVYGIGSQHHRVVERGKQRAVVDGTVGVAADLQHGDLGIGRRAPDLAGVRADDAGDVRAMVHAGQRARVDVAVMVGVVVHEGDLLAYVAAVLTLAHLRHLAVDAGFRFGKIGIIQVALEGGVVHVEPGVDDGDELAVAFLLDLVGGGHVERGLVGGRILHPLVGGDLVALLDEGVLHTVQVLDGFKQVGGRLDGEAVDGVVVVVELLELGLLRIAGVARGILRRGIAIAQQAEQAEALLLSLFLLHHIADLILEVVVTVLVHRPHHAAEQADAACARAVLQLHDDGNVALPVRIRGGMLHRLLDGVSRRRLGAIVGVRRKRRGRGNHQRSHQRQRKTRAHDAPSLEIFSHEHPSRFASMIDPVSDKR